MNQLLNQNLFFVREQVGFFKAANNYDILNPTTGQELLHCREPTLGLFTKMFRFSDYKRMTPFDVHVTTPAGQPVLRITRGISVFVSKVQVFDENNLAIGGFQQKFFSIGGAFDVLGSNGEALCTLKGKWTGWDFRFMNGQQELAHVTKKWAGLGKELFTTADNYILQIADTVPPNHPVRQLIMAAVLCIDMVLKE